MKNKTMKIISFALAAAVLISCFAVSGFAADAKAVLEYRVSEDGYATVYDCDETAAGSVVIPSEVQLNGKNYKVKYIGERAFDGCYYISDITIPEGVTAIRNHAFRDCVSLTDVYVPESLIVCQYDAFDGCASVTVHCYTSNYQFFTVFGISANIRVNVIDGKENGGADAEDAVQSDNFVLNFIEALKKLINSLVEYFNSDDEFEFDFPFDLPFDLPFDIEEL